MKAHSIGVDMNTADGSGSETSTPRKKRKRAQADSEEKIEEPDDNSNIKTEGQNLDTNPDDSPEESTYDEAKDFGTNMKIDYFDGFNDEEEAPAPEPNKLFIKQESS